MQKIIGIIGPLASGKDFASELISELLKIPIHQISGEIKSIAKEKGLGNSREELIELSRKISKKHGDGYFAEKICEKNNDDLLLICGMRQLGQLEYLRKNKDFILIGIESSSEVRFNRVMQRKKSGDPFTYEKFLEIERKDNNEGVQKVDECMKFANYSIKNEGTKKELEEKLIDILKKENLL